MSIINFLALYLVGGARHLKVPCTLKQSNSTKCSYLSSTNMTDIPQTLELIAAIAGVICVYLQTRENILAWPFGILSVCILVYVFAINRLYSDMILHFVYIGLNVYGWWYWTKKTGAQSVAPINKLSSKHMMNWILGIAIGTVLWGTVMNSLTDADVVYIDAFTTVGSLCAQYLLAKKVLQNWIIWVVVDVVAVNVYLYKELYFTAIMFFVFLLLCIKGYFDWRRQVKTMLSVDN